MKFEFWKWFIIFQSLLLKIEMCTHVGRLESIRQLSIFHLIY